MAYDNNRQKTETPQAQRFEPLCETCERTCKQDAHCVVVQCPKRLPRS